MRFLFDTNHASEFLKVPDAIDARVAKYPGAKFAVCPPVAAELWYMVHNSSRVMINRAQLERLFQRLEWLDFDAAAAETFGRLKVALRKAGKTVADVDLQIACSALVNGAVVLTGDGAFGNVPGLKVENWLTP